MSVVDDLKSAITDLAAAISSSTTEIEALLTKLATPALPAAEVQAAVDQIRELTAGINAEVTKAQQVSP